jgi:hypothetical protein
VLTAGQAKIFADWYVVRRTGIGPDQKRATLVLKDHRGLRVALFSERGWLVVYEGRRHEVLE